MKPKRLMKYLRAIYWLSAFAGSNPAPRILFKMIENLLNSYWILPLIVIVSYIILFLSTFLHELSHKIKFSKYGIKSKIYINWLGGLCRPIDKEEDKKSDELPNEAKREIIMSGTKTDLIIIIIFITCLAILLLLTYYKKINLHILLYSNLTLIAVLIIRASSVMKNLFYKGNGEIKGDLTELIYQISKK